jgi:hypothetical protein
MKDNNSELPLKALGRICLAASIVLLAVSLTGPGGEFLWGFLKPLSALLFVNFFIMNLLAKEYATYDEEQELRLALAKENTNKEPQLRREVLRHSPHPEPSLAH